MHFRFFSKLTTLRLAVIVIATFVAFSTVQQTAFAKSSSCPSASALCDGQPKLGKSGGSPVGLSPLKGMPGLPIAGTVKANHYYADGFQYFTAEGASGNFNQDAPYLAKVDAFSLAELAVESADGKQYIEVGWIVNKAGAGPDLFVSYWVGGVWSGYNPGTFVHIAGIAPGSPVAVDLFPDETHQYVIRFFQGNWWIRYENTWIGYFPGTLWTGQNKFTQVGLTQWFGEVSTYKRTPCSQMGDGIPGANPGSSVVNNMYFIVNGTAVSTNAQNYQPTPTYYTAGHFSPSKTSFNSFTYGGPGDTNPTDCPCEFCSSATGRPIATQGALAMYKTPIALEA